MKILLAGALLVSSNAFTHESSFNSGSCDIDVNGGVRISQSEIEFLKNNHHLYKIVNNRVLVVNNKEVELNSSQQEVVSAYSNDIRRLVPQVKNLAIDALSLASDGVNLAFNELLGPQNTLGEDLKIHFDEISNEIDKRFTADQTIYFDENGFSGTDFFGKDFEQRVENAVETTVQKSIGTIMVAIGQELLFSDEGVDSFETKMESFGEKIENEIEVRGKEIEKRAAKLCSVVAKIDGLETRLQQDIGELNDINMLTVKTTNNNAT